MRWFHFILPVQPFVVAEPYNISAADVLAEIPACSVSLKFPTSDRLLNSEAQLRCRVIYYCQLQSCQLGLLRMHERYSAAGVIQVYSDELPIWRPSQ